MPTEEPLPPNFAKLDTALRSIGYTFEAAVADVIDNSIDAGSDNVLVRLLAREDGNLDLAVWDDGEGMSGHTLKEAMRFGADVSHDINRLGKFGLGLKLASLSQARELRVVTQTAGSVAGRGWLEHGVAKEFSSTVFDAPECRQLLAKAIPDRTLRPHGTLVWWSHLYRISGHHAKVEERAQRLLRRLEDYLSLAFHRFLAGRPRHVSITLDIFDSATGKVGIPASLDSLDPFGYPQSGNNDFPAPMVVGAAYRGRLAVMAHIWPPNSTLPGYRLPGGANSRQGFYFYRNNRLIQGGGWNGTRETEPHLSLARLEIDIASDFDVDVSLDVKKVEVQLPPGLVTAIQEARTPSGVTFARYIALADRTYRKRKITESELPVIPSGGLPSPLSRFLHRELRIKATAKHRNLRIQWRQLPEDSFFEIEFDRGVLYLNQAFRRQLLHGLPGSSADIPVVKCLLFLVLADALSSERLGAKLRERAERTNRILVEAVKYERSIT